MSVRMSRIHLPEPKAFHLENWHDMTDPQRIAFMRDVAVRAGRDPRIRNLAASIVARLPQRAYKHQAAALLRWVQDHIQYLNEPGEIIQDPLYTLRHGYADCDDMAVLLGAFLEALRLDFRFVLAGKRGPERVRWHEGDPFPRGVAWSHVYIQVGTPAFHPREWSYMEPTVKGAPFGWDAGTSRRLPELAGLGISTGAAAGGAATTAAMADDSSLGISWKTVVASAITGVAVSVLSQMLLDEIQPALKAWRQARKRQRQASWLG